MDIDFSRLDAITSPAASDRQDHSQASQPEDQEALARLDGEKEAYNRLVEAYSQYQKNTKKSEALQEELLKGADQGEPVENLLLKACQAIALMTNNNSFYSHMEADLVAIYGEGLLEPVPLQRELEATRSRLNSLENALGENMPEDDKRRLKSAVEAHKKRIDTLQRLIEKSRQEGGEEE